MSNTIGSLVIDLVANTAQFSQQLNKAADDVKGLADNVKKGLEGIGLLVIADQIKEAVTASLEFGEAISKATAKTGVSAEAFSQLTFAAKELGISLPEIESGFEKMAKAISQASTGTGSGKTAFDALGISIAQLKSLQPDQQFAEIAEQFNKLPTAADKARAAIEIFGRAGADLLPLFEQGAAGIEEARQKAIAFGASLSDDQVKKLKAANESITDMKSSFSALATSLTAEVAPALKGFFDQINDVVTGNKINIVSREIDGLQESLFALQVNQERGNTPEQQVIQSQLAQAQSKLEALQLAAQIKSNLANAFSSSDVKSPGSAPGFQTPIPEILLNPNLKIQTDALKKFYDDLDAATQTGFEKLQTDTAKMQAQLDVLVHDGVISLGESFKRTDALQDATDIGAFFQNNASLINASFTEMVKGWKDAQAVVADDARIQGENMRETFQETANIAKQAGQSIQDFFANMFENIGKGGLAGLVKNFVDAFRQIIAQAAAMDLAIALGIKSAFSNQGSGSALGSIFSGFSSLFGGGSGAAATTAAASEGPFLATGGQFTVPGSAGVDSRLVRFHATPGETVTVTRPDQTMGANMTFAPVYNVGSGVSRSDVVSACQATQRSTMAAMTRLIKGGGFQGAGPGFAQL